MSDEFVGIVTMYLFIGLIVQFFDSRGPWHRFATVFLYLPWFVLNRGRGIFTRPLPPLWTWLFFPIGPLVWIWNNWREPAHDPDGAHV